MKQSWPAHADVWVPRVLVNQDMDAHVRFLYPLQFIQQLPSGVKAFRDVVRSYDPSSQALSLAQLQKFMHLVGNRSVGVTDRLIVFERDDGEHGSEVLKFRK